MQNYCNNVASPDNTSCFNLASHEAYLDSVTATGGITSRIVMFYQEGGRRYLEQRGVKDLTLYDNSWKLVLPCTVSVRFPDRTNHGNREGNDGLQTSERRNREGRRQGWVWAHLSTGVVGLALRAGPSSGVPTTLPTDEGDKVVGVNVCPMCRFWNTNDVTLNNHVRKHYNMGLCCPEGGLCHRECIKDVQTPEGTNTTTRCAPARTSKPTSRPPRRLHIKESPSDSRFKCR